MPSAWRGTIGDLKHIIETGEYIDVIESGFSSSFNQPTSAESRSWEQSLPRVVDALSDSEFSPLKVILELAMPIGAERADMVILGGTKSRPKMIVCELKQWSKFEINEATFEVLVPGIGYRQNPSLQALNYRGKLLFFNERGALNEIKACVFAHNATEKDKVLLLKFAPNQWAAQAPVFTSENKLEFQGYVRDFLIPPEFECNEAEKLDLARYRQSNKLFEHLEKHGKDIANHVAEALANSGMGLTEEQAQIENEVMRLLSSDQSLQIIVQGGPGSGKTLLAVSLLLRAAQLNYQTIFAIRNNRLQTILRRILDESLPGLSALTFYFNAQGKSLRTHEGNLDLLICDEAQRMDKTTVQVTPEKARVSVIFLDESQRLNPPEQGTTENFSNACKELHKEFTIKTLSSAIRCAGGEPYHNWIEALLKTPSAKDYLIDYKRRWQAKYEFASFSNISALLKILEFKLTPEIRIALAASFTESPGKMDDPDDPDNLRIGYLLPSGFTIYKNSNVRIPWLMSTRDYQKFWIDGRSNKLDRVASIYGAQGFETDYLGLVWGRDLLYRNGQWILGDPNICYDTIDKLVISSKSGRNWNGDVLPLLINRYRIFLTRGIRGTFLFCEDEETRNYFNDVATMQGDETKPRIS